MKPLSDLIAEQLRIPAARVRDDLSFGGIPEWDSLNHVNLMTALEKEYGVTIDEDLMVELIDVRAIRSLVDRTAPPSAGADGRGRAPSTDGAA
jgi:acyl carrier protein